MLFETSNYFKDYDLNFIEIPIMQSDNCQITVPELYEVTEGFLRGNMFKSLYDDYKNYKPIIPEIKNEREKLLFEVQKYDFAINDLNLYLDLYPNDSYVFNLLKKFIVQYKKHKEVYEQKYGLLCLDDSTSNKYDWLESPWPWDGGENV